MAMSVKKGIEVSKDKSSDKQTSFLHQIDISEIILSKKFSLILKSHVKFKIAKNNNIKINDLKLIRKNNSKFILDIEEKIVSWFLKIPNYG